MNRDYAIATYLGVGSEYSIVIDDDSASTLTLVVESGPACNVIATRPNTVANQRELAQMMITLAINEVEAEQGGR